jgi:hypothetical protein
MMGETILQREFNARPPTTQLNSISALWKDYMLRYINTGRGDPALPWTLKAEDFETAIHRACMSRGEDGTLWHHQGRVWQVNLEAYEKTLQEDYADDLYESKYFWELFGHCRRAASQTHGIGPVTEYDVAMRLGGWLDLEPEHLYFHAGVTEGLRALGVAIPRGATCIDRERLPEFFWDKNLDIVESFLCGYRSEIQRVMEMRHRRAQRQAREAASERAKQGAAAIRGMSR